MDHNGDWKGRLDDLVFIWKSKGEMGVSNFKPWDYQFVAVKHEKSVE